MYGIRAKETVLHFTGDVNLPMLSVNYVFDITNETEQTVGGSSMYKLICILNAWYCLTLSLLPYLEKCIK
jgi:hypothetical protein